MKVIIDYPGLSMVVSGGQTGADQAGIKCARDAWGLKTGGFIPAGFRTVFGPQPDLAQYGLQPTKSSDYPPRTRKNVELADATVRFASNFRSAGERLTLKYCQAAGKPVYDVLLDGNDYEEKAHGLVEFLKEHNVRILNVAGNADRDKVEGFHFIETWTVLNHVFRQLVIERLLIRECDSEAAK